MNYENKIVLLSAKAYFSTRQKTNAHEELPHRTIATHHHCHYLRYTFRKFPTGFAGTAVRNIQCHFSEFLNFSIPLIIVGLVTIAIADIGKGAGRMLVVTALIAYGATLFSGFLSYFTGMAVFPSLIETGVPLEEVSESQGILPYFPWVSRH